ncbi:MAG: C40 family peptidase [Muribaculaceae bacterium]
MKDIKYFILIPFMLILLCINTSCHSSKKNIKGTEYEYNDKGILGFNITKHDNKKLYREAQKWIGTPYQYGGHTKDGTDCSGLVMEIYLEVYNTKLQRNSAKIMSENCREISRNTLKEGDLIFFATGKNSNRISHVGLYLKDGKFIHSSSSRGVIISELEQKYYQRTFVCAGRVRR